jgi:hypothetical protein
MLKPAGEQKLRRLGLLIIRIILCELIHSIPGKESS